MKRQFWPWVWIGLTILGAAAIVLAYTEARLIPTGRGTGQLTHCFFDTAPWAPFAAAALGVLVASRTRRSDPRIEGNRVLRHDGAAMLAHWTHGISCVLLLATGFALGLFVIPRVWPDGPRTSFLFNAHFVAVLFFLFGTFYWAANMVVAPRRFVEHLPTKDSLRETLIHYGHMCGLTRKTVAAGKYHGSERLAFLMTLFATVPVVISGFFKVAARFAVMPPPLMVFMTWVHDVFTVIMLLYLIPHVLLGALVPWSWPLLRSMFTGYVTRRYATESHAEWIERLEAERKGI